MNESIENRCAELQAKTQNKFKQFKFKCANLKGFLSTLYIDASNVFRGNGPTGLSAAEGPLVNKLGSMRTCSFCLASMLNLITRMKIHSIKKKKKKKPRKHARASDKRGKKGKARRCSERGASHNQVWIQSFETVSR